MTKDNNGQLASYSDEELRELYQIGTKLRDDVLEFVQKLGYDTNALITRNLLQDIERVVGQRTLLQNGSVSHEE